MSVPFVHRTSLVNVLAPLKTMLYLLHRYCALSPEETCCSLPPEETSCFLPPEESSCSLPPEETSCFLPHEDTCCSLPPEETNLPPEKTSYFLPPKETPLFSYCLWTIGGLLEVRAESPSRSDVPHVIRCLISGDTMPLIRGNTCLLNCFARGFWVARSERVSIEGFHRRDSIVLIGGCPIREVLLLRLEVARSEGFYHFDQRLVQSELGSIELDQSCLVPRSEVFVLEALKLARLELVVAHPDVARPELAVVSRLELARPELVVACPESETFGSRMEIDSISFGDVWGSTRDRFNLVRRRLGLSRSLFRMLISYGDTLGSRSEKHAKASSEGFPRSESLSLSRPLIKELGEEADVLLIVAPVEEPHSRSEGVRVEVRNTIRDQIGKELFHLAPSPYYMPYPYDEGLSSHPPNMKGEWGEAHAVKLVILKKKLFKDPKVCKAIIDRVPTPTQFLRTEGLTLKELFNYFQSNANNQPMLLRSKTLIIIRIDQQESQVPVHVEHLSAELARPKEANHALEKANHSRCKKYKKYKAERNSLVLEKERLENEVIEILEASKQDKESFAKDKS
ncbi:hypothetical protein Tco_0524204 [Tanacetum coccineum]